MSSSTPVIKWNTEKKKYPQFISPDHIKIWNEQKRYLTSNIGLQQHLYYIEWPNYLEEESAPPSVNPDILTNWENNPLLRDKISPVELDIPTIWVQREHLITVMNFLKTDDLMSYTYLLDLTAADFLNSPLKTDIEKNQGKRFRMIYLLRSMPGYNSRIRPEYRGLRLRVVVPIDINDKVPSLTSLWAGANWPEREVYDLMGLEFEGHPDLRRILMPEQYKGHPLRKDFPLKGMGEDYLIQNLLDEHLLED